MSQCVCSNKENSDEYWHNIINQLIHRGFLRVDITQNAVLKLTEEARPILQKTLTVELAVPRLNIDLGKTKQLSNQEYDRPLFAKLKYLRKTIAEREDVPPFVKAAREPLSYVGINSIGLRRRGFTSAKIKEIQDIYRILYQKNYNNSQALEIIEAEMEATPERDEIMLFIRNSQRGIMKGYSAG